MKRILPFAIVLTVAGVCCIVAAYFCHFYYTLYRQASTELEQSVDSRIKALQYEVQQLAKQKHFMPVRARGWISTTDLQPNESLGYTTNELTLGQSKGGWVITPELRLESGSTHTQEFRVTLWPTNTRVMDAWVSPPESPEALAAFYTFAVSPDDGTNSITLRVRAKPKTSVKHEFTVVVVRDCAE